MKLYMHPFSQHSRRVSMLCQELGLEPEIVPVALESGEHKSEAFLKLNPSSQVPVLEDEGFVLPESHAIMKYLASSKNGESFYPTDNKARANVDMWLDWNHTRLNPPVQTIAIHTLFMGEKGDKDLVKKSREQASAAFNVLERALPLKAGIGGAATLADISVATTVALFEMVGGDIAAFPATAAWFDEMKKRPSFQNTAPKRG